MKMKKIQLVYVLCATLLMSGCHIYKAYDRPDDLNTAGLYRDPYSSADTLVTDTVNMGNLPWQEVFSDPQLQALIERALANNVDLQTANLRVEESRAMLTSARLSFLPSVGLAPQGSLSHLEGGDWTRTYQLPATASWEIDLFGRLLNASRGSKATLLQSEAYRQAVRSQLIANVANTYYTLLMLDRQLAISEETSAVWKENVRAMVALKEVGMTNEAAVSQAKANSYQVETSLADLRRQIRETENAFSVMLAEAPHRIERGNLENQVLPDDLHAGIPLQMLANRPDVRAAEMQLAVAYYATNQARSAFYPQLVLNGSVGWTNSAGGVILDPAKWLVSAVGSLTQPLFNKGRNVANLKVAKARQEEASLLFQQSLLVAGKEVSNALFTYETASQKMGQRRAQVEVLQNAVVYTQALFRSGSSTYLETLTAQQSLLSAQLSEVSDTFQRMQSVVSLYQALGGGRE